ncbi:MAG: DUF4258 domain-containing protein [Planctomycetales bacterium]|nr:DUF4258 domain-containing protein [Planctomycetales bacterium]
MDLIETIRRAVADGRYRITLHAAQRLAQRGLELWQLEIGLEEGDVLDVRDADLPNPSIVVVQELPDGTEVNAVWSYIAVIDTAQLVTAHFFDGG